MPKENQEDGNQLSNERRAPGCLGMFRGLYLPSYVGIIINHPIGSMYGIFTYIYHKNQPNVGKYTIHGSYGH